MNIEYFFTKQAQDSIDIEDIGNCCINTLNDEGQEWYMSIETSLGWTKVKQYGPLTVDSDFVDNFSFSMFKMEFNGKQLYKIIKDFLNNPHKNITQVELVDMDTFSTRLSHLQEEY